ncbi:MAG: undecaprenyl-diphosphate phosphatase [Sphaerochaetaceae bacterium]|nr:undecaprenyl-diphosphate phosphatase [Sphaerochaetaceae bacterium]
MIDSLTVFESVFLGIVQGLTEFLPVSSSGHLVLARHLFDMPQVPLLFDVTLHVATLIVVLFFYRSYVWNIARALITFLIGRANQDDYGHLRILLNLFLATCATIAVALVLREILPEKESVSQVAILMYMTAVLLLYKPVEKKRGTVYEMRVSQALIVGAAQGFGTLAGISRSGVTITASHAAGLARTEAGTFSFLLSIPAILGALVLTLVSSSGEVASVSPLVLAIGSISAMIVGFFSLKMLLWVIEKAKLWYFSIYLVCASTLLLLFARS